MDGTSGMLPHNDEAERAVLGALLRDPAALPVVAGLLSREDFSQDAHQRIYATSLELHTAGQPIDVVLLCEALHRRKWLEDVGGPAYLGRLLDGVVSTANVEYHARIIREKSQQRRLFHAANELIRDTRGGTPPEQLLEEMRRRLDEVACERPAGHWAWSPIDSGTFAATDYRPTWYVQRIFVKDQPLIVGGPPKSLKTSIGVDLAVSLAAGAPFLGRFDVCHPVRTAVLSGESGAWTLQDLARRVAVARGRDLSLLGDGLLWQTTLPRLTDRGDLRELSRGLKASGIGVVLIDPLYLALLAGAKDVNTSNLYEMGPLLSEIATACLRAGCTPVLVHHVTKPAAARDDAPGLGDLSGAGLGEFARQWMLLGRRERYVPGQPFKLWLSAGGSCGQGGQWALDVDEGRLGEDFGGRHWDVTVADGEQAWQEQAERRRQQSQQRRCEKDEEDRDRLLRALDQLDPKGVGVSFTKVRDAAGLSGKNGNRALSALSDLVEEVPGFRVTTGNGATRKARGIRRRRDG